MCRGCAGRVEGRLGYGVLSRGSSRAGSRSLEGGREGARSSRGDRVGSAVLPSARKAGPIEEAAVQVAVVAWQKEEKRRSCDGGGLCRVRRLGAATLWEVNWASISLKAEAGLARG